MDISDNHIVTQIKQGDIEAYSELVQRYQKPVFNLMYRFSQSKTDAAELTQDAFCKAFEKLPGFQNDRKFFSWLYTLAVNHGKDFIRRQERKRDGIRLYTGNMEQENSSLPLEIVEKRQEIDKMFIALSRLPHEKREMLLLRYQQELSINELGEIFDLSSSAVKMRIHRSLALLQNQLNGESQTDE
jgi:RNA polymerase sigma-70 factor (ECF subfamily)